MADRARLLVDAASDAFDVGTFNFDAVVAAVLRVLIANPDGYLRMRQDGAILYAKTLRVLADRLDGKSDAEPEPE